MIAETDVRRRTLTVSRQTGGFVRAGHAQPEHPADRPGQFLRMLAASPALPYVALSPKILHALGQEPFREGDPAGELIASPEEALTVFDFEAVAKEKQHCGHVAFLRGTEDEGTYRANREGSRSTSSASGAWSTSAASTCRCRSSGRARTLRSSSAPAARLRAGDIVGGPGKPVWPRSTTSPAAVSPRRPSRCRACRSLPSSPMPPDRGLRPGSGARPRLRDGRPAAQLVSLGRPVGDGWLHLVPMADGNRVPQLGLRHAVHTAHLRGLDCCGRGRHTAQGRSASVGRRSSRTPSRT